MSAFEAGRADEVERAHQIVESVRNWRHRIELAPGVVTPGRENHALELSRLDLPANLAGKRVLDVGCSDGFYSFLCERRGAEVVGIDDESSLIDDANGFLQCARHLGSTVTYRTADIERVSPEELGTFDLVLFINVLYHLPNPMLALRNLAALTRPGGSMIIKTHFRTDVRVWVRGRCLGFDLDRRPKWWYFPGTELGGDPTNWWSPNRSGLEGMLSATGWGDLTHLGSFGDRTYYRAIRGSE